MKDEKFVYLVQSGNRLKIGISVNVDTRIEKFATTCPDAPIILAVVAGGREKEKELHIRFRPFRVRGEWFENAPEIREYFSVENYQPVDREPQFGDLVLVVEGRGVGTVGEYDDDDDGLAIVYPFNREDCRDYVEIKYKNLKTVERLNENH